MNQFNQSRPWLQTVGLIIIILGIILLTAYCTNAKQIQPDIKRVKQIQTALEEHGYVVPECASWKQTQEILRSIARDHEWQTRRAPDARVLILIGLGNQYSDPWVTELGKGELDGNR
jgi:hypothetical protein